MGRDQPAATGTEEQAESAPLARWEAARDEAEQERGRRQAAEERVERLTALLARERELRQKYKGSVLGLLWYVVNPLVLMGAYGLMFGVLLKAVSIDDYPLFLFVGLIVWLFFSQSVLAAATSLLDQASLVGPRPLPQRDFDQLDDWHKKRYLVLPGITGLWQVSGRSELDFDDLVRLDFLYLERWSVGLDLAILLKTIPAVLLRRGAF